MSLTVCSNKEDHARRRRLMGQVYNRSKMDNLHDLMAEEVEKFLNALEGQADSCVELVTACRALEADIICEFRL